MVHFKVVVKNVKIDFYLVEHTLLVHLFKFKKLQLDILFSFQVCKSVYPLYSVTIQCNRTQMCHFCSILEFFLSTGSLYSRFRDNLMARLLSSLDHKKKLFSTFSLKKHSKNLSKWYHNVCSPRDIVFSESSSQHLRPESQ